MYRSVFFLAVLFQTSSALSATSSWISPTASGAGDVATIPAFPEQSASCPLDLSPNLLQPVSLSCSTSDKHQLPPSRNRCCPALFAALLSAHSAAALTNNTIPAAAAAAVADMPVLPNDSEACAAAAEAALRA